MSFRHPASWREGGAWKMLPPVTQNFPLLACAPGSQTTTSGAIRRRSLMCGAHGAPMALALDCHSPFGEGNNRGPAVSPVLASLTQWE